MRSGIAMAGRRVALLAGLLASMAASGAQAAAYTLNVTGLLDLGTVAAAASGDTVFRIDPATGAVSVVAGAGRRLSTTSARVQVNIRCRPSRAEDTDCTTKNVAIRVGTIGTLQGRARAFTAFYAASGAASIVGAPSGTVPLAFELAPLGNNVQRTFFVGADFPVAGDDSGLPSGLGKNAFFVNVVDAAGLILTGDSDEGNVRAFRALAIASTQDLSFGRIQRPTLGNNTVVLAAGTGARTLNGTGNGVLYPTPSPTRAAFTIAGEGGQQVSIAVPSSLTLTGPGTLTVSVTDTAPNTRALSGALGAAGTFSFNVGGSFAMGPSTPVGTYSGTLTVTVDYN